MTQSFTRAVTLLRVLINSVINIGTRRRPNIKNKMVFLSDKSV